MITALIVLSSSVLLVLLAPSILRVATRAGRHPLLGLALWLGASWSAVAASLVAASLVAIPGIEADIGLPVAVHDCLLSIQGGVSGRHPGWLQVTAVAVLTAMGVRILWCAVNGAVVTRRRRSRHRAVLDLVGRHDPSLRAEILIGEVPLVYCVPRVRGGRIVVTTAALARLTVSERAAALAHERAHLAGGHQLLLASADLLGRAFPRSRLCAQARAHTATLLEMRADDVAAQSHGRPVVARALLSLADRPHPLGTFGAAGDGTAERIVRLTQPRSQERRSTRAVTRGVFLVAASLMLVAPLFLAGAGHFLLCPA